VTSVLSGIPDSAAALGDLKSERIVLAIELQVLSGKLPSGARLATEGELCDILGVSRSVVRDSMRTLVARGLVTFRQGLETTVAQGDNESAGNYHRQVHAGILDAVHQPALILMLGTVA